MDSCLRCFILFIFSFSERKRIICFIMLPIGKRSLKLDSERSLKLKSNLMFSLWWYSCCIISHLRKLHFKVVIEIVRKTLCLAIVTGSSEVFERINVK